MLNVKDIVNLIYGTGAGRCGGVYTDIITIFLMFLYLF